MRRTAAAIVLAILSYIPLSAGNAHFSVMPLSWEGSNHCTAFSINEKEGLWSTARHCLNFNEQGVEDMWIGGEAALVELQSQVGDSLVLRSGYHAPALKLAVEAPKPQEEISVKGHPFGLVGIETPAFLTKGVFLTTYNDEDGVWNMYDVSIGPGNSGSPVYTKKGVIGTLNFTYQSGGLSGGTPWAILDELRQLGKWVN